MNFKFPILVSFFILLFSCAKDVNHDYSERISIPSFGSDETLDIATWNIENFPRTGITDSIIVSIIDQLELDLIAVQEIVDQPVFFEMVDQMPGYNGKLVSYQDLDGYGYITQNVGLIFNSSYFNDINESDMELLFVNDNNFPRPPLKVALHYSKDGKDIDFYAIIIHLKAMSDANSVSRRKNSIESLYNYLNDRQEDEEKDYIILGDWNSDYSQENFMINTFHVDSAYSVLTYDFFESSDKYIYNSSYPNYPSLIDHIVISKSYEEQMAKKTIKTIRIDDYYSKYLDLVSDHRPVAVKFTLN